MNLPSYSMTMRVPMRNALSISCVTMMLVAHVCLVNEMMSSSMMLLVTGSSPAEGSSKRINSGFEHERAGEADAFFHAAAEFGGHGVLDVAHLHEVEFFVDGAFDVASGPCR